MNYTDFSLKVLKGRHLDALVSISHSRLTVGGDGCDVTLMDLDSNKKYLELVFSDKDIFIKCFDAPVLLEGVALATPSTYVKYKPYQLIDFGSCSIAVGSTKGVWPLIGTSLSQPQQFNNEKTPLSLMSLSKVLLVSLALVTVIISVLLFSNYDQVMEIPSKTTSISQRIRVLIDDKDFHDVMIKKDLNGRIRLVGTVIDFESKEELEKLVTSVTSRYSSDIYIMKNIELEAKIILKTYGIDDVDLSLDNNILTIKGYTNGDWKLAKSSILEDLPSITKVEDAFLSTPDKRLQDLILILKEKGLSDKVSLKDEKGVITSSGELASTEVESWENTKKSFIRGYDSRFELTDNVIDLAEKINLSIQSVSIGQNRYFVSTKGHKYLIGSDLGDGYTVESIEADQIVLRYKGDSIRIKYFNIDKNPENIKIFI